MKPFLTIIAVLLIISFSYGQKYIKECPKFSVSVDSVAILNVKFENNLRKRVQKYKPERRIVILWFNYNYKKSDSILTVTLFNKKSSSYYHLIKSKKIYGYFTIDSVLFVIKNENVLQSLFILTENNKKLYTEEVDCNAVTFGQLTGFECIYKVKTKRGKIKLRKESAFLHKTKQMLIYSFHRFGNLFRKDDISQYTNE